MSKIIAQHLDGSNCYTPNCSKDHGSSANFLLSLLLARPTYTQPQPSIQQRQQQQQQEYQRQWQ